MPRLLIEDELARGDLVVACNQPLLDERAYYLVTPMRDTEPAALRDFRQWLVEVTGGPNGTAALVETPHTVPGARHTMRARS